MVRPQPLSPGEELVWRSFIRLATTLPRALDQDLERDTGFSIAEYAVLMHLSEATGRGLRMAELADCSALSPSRMTRLVGDLEARGLVRRSADPGDRRGTVTALTAAGGRALRSAYPKHLAQVRRRLVDHLDPAEVALLGPLLRRLADLVDDRPCPERAI